MDAFLDSPFTVAVIVAVPAAFAVISPFEDTLATELSELFHTTPGL